MVGLRLVVGDGSVVVLDDDQDPGLRDVARVGLGALGVVTEVTIQMRAGVQTRGPSRRYCRSTRWWPASRGGPRRADHVEFFWMPHTGFAQVKRNTRTTETPPPPCQLEEGDASTVGKRFKNEELMSNVAFGAMKTPSAVCDRRPSRR
ncbi:MAG: hypothetical protein CM1200mP26_26780 [Acidimicrobiales bacterium]|nr:MAG: hypothetical protein CM1200mP26_26780 [Acidimicrobiales bacterium]